MDGTLGGLALFALLAVSFCGSGTLCPRTPLCAAGCGERLCDVPHGGGWLLAKIGLLKPEFMRKYRKHAIVVILIIAAVITPTGDAMTLSLVALPIYALYEISILVVKKTIAS